MLSKDMGKFDATEWPAPKPKLLTTGQLTFSMYKTRNTSRVLIGVMPDGLVSYVSPAYGSCASDRQC